MKKLTTIFYTILILLFIAACADTTDNTVESSNDEVIIPIEPRIKYIDGEINDLLASIRSESQKFAINSSDDTFLVGENGTLISIPKGTFLNDRNQTVQGEIKIELIEAINISDFVLNGLQTTSDRSVLKSGGMIFIDATQNNEPLKIDPNKQITIDFKTDWVDPKMQLFIGDLFEGSVNWIKSGKLESDYLISVPLDLLEFGICGWECAFTEDQISEMKKSEFQDTYISTREFEQRMCELAFLTCEQYNPLIDNILKIYKDNIKRNLSYADSMVVKHFEEIYGDIIDSNYIKDVFHFDEKGWITGMYMNYLALAKQGLSKPLSVNGIDWNSNISRVELEKKGYSEKDIDKIISYKNSRNRVMQELKDEAVIRKIASYNFNINELGWINIDAFLDDPTCKESDFEVVISSKDSINTISVSLVIPSRKVSVFSITNHGNTYSFTKNKEGYRKLPINERAFIVAIGVNKGVPFFGMKEIKIPRNGTIQLNIKQTEKDIIEREIKEISKTKTI